MAEKVKEKAPIRKELKEKVKAAPKELLRRGLSDGTQRLRGQLRDTAQRGQRDDYGGDQIEDAAWRGGRWGERSIEKLLRKKKSAKDRLSGREPRTPDSPTPPEALSELPPESPVEPPPKSPARRSPEFPSESPLPHEPYPRERSQIKTREAVFVKEGGVGAGPSESGRARLSPGERMRQTQIKTRESAVRTPHPDVLPAPQAGSEPPQVRTREAAVCDIPTDIKPAPRVRSGAPKIKTRDAAPGVPTGHRSAEPFSGNGQSANRLSIKTRNAYIQSQPVSTPEQPPQALVQGEQEFMREQGRAATIKRAEVQRVRNGAVPQAGTGGESASPTPVRRGYTGGQGKYTSVQAMCGPTDSGGSDALPVRDSGQKIIKTVRSGRKSADRAAKQTIKTAERSSKKVIKTTQRTTKTSQHTATTAQATVKATQRAVQAVRAIRKPPAVTVRGAAKAGTAALRATVKAARTLAAVLAAGGSVVVSVILVLCLVGVLVASPFGIFFADSSSPDTVAPSAAVAQINGELSDYLSGLQAGGTYDRVEVLGQPPAWSDVFAVFAAKTAGAADGVDVVTLDAARVDLLRAVFWDMTKITTEEKTVDHLASGNTPAWSETVLKITITPRTSDDMRVLYSFTDAQNQALDALLSNGGLLTTLTGDLTISSQDAKALLAALPEDLDPERRAVVETACQLVGKLNYFWGGKSRVLGWDERWGQIKKVTASGSSSSGTYRPFGLDCSGFVDWVFYNMTGGSYIIGHGGGAHSQHGYCTAITWDQAIPGDLVFYPGDTHVGIVGGRDESGNLLIIHCTYSKNNVVITDKSGFTSIARPNYYSE